MRGAAAGAHAAARGVRGSLHWGQGWEVGATPRQDQQLQPHRLSARSYSMLYSFH